MRLLLLLLLRKFARRRANDSSTEPRYEAQFNHRKRTESD